MRLLPDTRFDSVIVTAIIDLGGRSTRTRSSNELVHLFRHVLDIGLPVVVYASPRIAASLETLVAENITVVSTTLATLPGFDPDRFHLITSAAAKGVRPATSRDEQKDTPDYIALQLMKPHLLCDALNRTTADRAWWLDAGIAHACHVPGGLDRTMRSVAMRDALIVRDLRAGRRPPAWTARDGLGLASGGCFAVMREQASWLASAFDEVADATLRHGQLPLDEQILTDIALQNGDRVSVLSGWHQCLLDSLSGLTADPTTTDIRRDTDVSQRTRLPVARIVELHLPLDVPDGWSQFNPSIAADEEGRLAVIVRSSNYRLTGSDYLIAGGERVIRTRNAFVTLDDDLGITYAAWIDDRELPLHDRPFPVTGFEDARLVHRAGSWWLLASIRQHATSGAVRQIVGRIDEAAGVRLDVKQVLHSPVAAGDLEALVYEKNWMLLPGDDDDRLQCVWSVEPFVTVEVDGLTGHVVASGRPAMRVHPHRLRGSTPFVHTPSGPLAIVHEVDDGIDDPARPHRAYRHRFVIHQDGGLRIGPPWIVEEHGLEYVAGIAVIGDRVLISYGRDDRSARVAECRWGDLAAFLPGPHDTGDSLPSPVDAQ